MLDFLLGNNFLSAIIAFVLILIPAVIIHELGHFLAAKAIGVTVLEFGIGFPPRVGRLFMWGETEFTLNWLPIGGFVRPLGEDLVGPAREKLVDKDASEPEKPGLFGRFTHMFDQQSDGEDSDQASPFAGEREELLARGVREEDMMSVNEARPWPRIFFMAAGALANFILAIVLFMIVALTGLPEVIGARLQFASLPEDSDYARAGIAEGDVVELVDGQYFADQETFFELIADAAGQTVTLSLRKPDSDQTTDISLTAPDQPIRPYVRVVAVQDGSPAMAAGLQPDDLITAVAGQSLSESGDVIAAIQAASDEYAGEPLALSVLRDGEILELTVTPRTDAAQGRIGIGIEPQYASDDDVVFAEAAPQIAYVAQPLGRAAAFGFERTGDTLALIASIPSQIIQGAISVEDARPVSVVGISQVGGQFLQQSIEQSQPILILNFIALVSIFLGITNLLPIPALDGGRILFVLIELVRGRPMEPEREGAIHRMGFVILLSLGLVIIVYDIFNPFVLPQ